MIEWRLITLYLPYFSSMAKPCSFATACNSVNVRVPFTCNVVYLLYIPRAPIRMCHSRHLVSRAICAACRGWGCDDIKWCQITSWVFVSRITVLISYFMVQTGTSQAESLTVSDMVLSDLSHHPLSHVAFNKVRQPNLLRGIVCCRAVLRLDRKRASIFFTSD